MIRRHGGDDTAVPTAFSFHAKLLIQISFIEKSADCHCCQLTPDGVFRPRQNNKPHVGTSLLWCTIGYVLLVMQELACEMTMSLVEKVAKKLNRSSGF